MNAGFASNDLKESVGQLQSMSSGALTILMLMVASKQRSKGEDSSFWDTVQATANVLAKQTDLTASNLPLAAYFMSDDFKMQLGEQATLSVDLKFNLNRLEANPTNPYEGLEINLDYLPVPSISSEFNGFSIDFHLTMGTPEALIYLDLGWYAWFQLKATCPKTL